MVFCRKVCYNEVWLIHEDLKKIWIRGKKIELERGK